MATLLSLLNPMTPVTPPPENMTFTRPTCPPRPPQLKRTAGQAGFVDGGCLPLPLAGEAPSQSCGQPQSPPLTGASPALDPRYMAMVARVSAYYHQRSQAIAAFQHQRCQAWATMHRQKCEQMIQASMLVVAWHIRDRITRRRRKEKRRFRAGLELKASGVTKITRGETVRRWVMNVPDVTLPPQAPAATDTRDADEADFNIDHCVASDKDDKLFETADNLIRSQYRKVEVPLMGALDLEVSDAESEEDEEEEDDDDEDIDEDMDDELVEEEDDDDAEGDVDEDYQVKDHDKHDRKDKAVLVNDNKVNEDEDDDLGSEVVHDGTVPGSRRNDRSISA